jgi:prolyl-tRNA synthetase
MKASRYFWSTLKENPRDAEIVSHRLSLRAGLVQQIVSGIYAWLPMGLRVLQKIEHIVRQEQNRIGCLEMLAPTLQPAELWQKSGRYNDYGKELLRVWDRHEKELLYGPTAEEVFTEVFQTHINSYRQLPLMIYNIQWKFRDEIRPRFGVMRGREFLMKDTYSFDITPEAAAESYHSIFKSYMRTFQRMDLQAIPVRASTGPIGGDLSHEFQILAATGENELYYQAEAASSDLTFEKLNTLYAASDEKHNPETCPIPLKDLRVARGIEVGHIFYFGTKYSKALGAMISTREGTKIPAEMGSYGIGVSRLVGAIIEAHHDEKGICFPMSVSPFPIGLMSVQSDEATVSKAEAFYEKLVRQGHDVLYHDLQVGTGQKFAELDLLGCNYQVIISQKNQNQIEIKSRKSGETQHFSEEEALSWLKTACVDNICLGY